MDAAAESCGYPIKYACLFASQEIMVAGALVPMSTLVSDLRIDTDAYASFAYLYRFDLLMKLYLAGIKEIPFSERGLSTFEEIGQFLYPTQQQALLDWEYTTF